MATLTVRGTASVPAEPDEATVAITLSGLRATPDEAYAEALGVRLLALETATELGSLGGGGPVARLSIDAAPIPVEPGEQMVAAAVDLTYALEQS